MMPLLLALAAASTAWARSAVVVLRSDDQPVYDAPVEALRQAFDRPVQVIDLHGQKQVAEQVARGLVDDPPPVIVALGAKAAWTAVQKLPQVPVVYAMVHHPERYGLTGTFVTGVTMQVPPDLALAQIRLFAPDIKHIGLLVSSSNANPAIGEAIQAGRDAGLTVTARRVSGEKDTRRAFQALARDVDAVWLLPDAQVVTPATFQFITAESMRSRLPVLAWSEPLVQAGALLCVAPDTRRVGEQAADLAKAILEGATAGSLPPVAPDTPRVVLNRDTLDGVGLKLDPGVLDFVDEVVREPTRR